MGGSKGGLHRRGSFSTPGREEVVQRRRERRRSTDVVEKTPKVTVRQVSVLPSPVERLRVCSGTVPEGLHLTIGVRIPTTASDPFPYTEDPWGDYSSSPGID